MAARLPHFNVTAPAERNGGLIHGNPTVNWLDELEAPEQPAQDTELRRLVDLLPENERHVIERVFFGGTSSHAAARELGLEPYHGERLKKAGMEQLRQWLTEGDAPKRDPGRRRGRVKKEPEPEHAWEALDPVALESTMSGRYRGDRRRLDAYTPYEQEGRSFEHVYKEDK